MAHRLTLSQGREHPLSDRLSGISPVSNQNPLLFKKRLFIFICLLFLLFYPKPARSETEEKGPIYLKSDSLQYFKETDIYLAVGSVIIEQGALKVKADSARLKGESGEVDAFGNVHFSDGENAFEARRVLFNIDTQLGVLYQGKLFIKSDNYYINGEKIVRMALDRYELKIGNFTACDCQENPAWRIQAGELNLQLDNYLFAKNVVFYVKDVPIFYLPYFIYPVKTERQSGLLVPHIGYSSLYGFRYRQEFFWAISKQQDATFALEHRGKKGEGLGLEYRYVLSRKSFGQLNTMYFKDRENKVDRWEVRYTHDQRLSDRVRAKLDISYINENDSFRDLSDRTAERALQNIESNLFVTYHGEVSFAYLLARYTQDLLSLSNNQTPQKLPEIGYNLIEYRLGESPVYFNFESTAVNFWSEGGLNLQRMDFYPKLSLPIPLTSGANLTPWAGFRETWYSEGALTEPSISRAVFPAGITLDGRTAMDIGAGRYVFNPTLFYENILVEEEGDILQIDAIDALHDRESLTLTLMQRYITLDEKGIPQEKLGLRFTETLHLDTIPTAALNTRRFSDLRAELHLQPWTPVSLHVDSFYDVYDNRFIAWNTDLQIVFSSYLSLSITQRETRDGTLAQKGDLFNPYYLGDREAVTPAIDFLSEEIAITTPWGIRFINRAYYDVDQSKVVEIDYILEFQAQCWALGLSYLDFHDRDEFSFLITLKGLGGFSPEQ